MTPMRLLFHLKRDIQYKTFTMRNGVGCAKAGWDSNAMCRDPFCHGGVTLS